MKRNVSAHEASGIFWAVLLTAGAALWLRRWSAARETEGLEDGGARRRPDWRRY